VLFRHLMIDRQNNGGVLRLLTAIERPGRAPRAWGVRRLAMGVHHAAASRHAGVEHRLHDRPLIDTRPQPDRMAVPPAAAPRPSRSARDVGSMPPSPVVTSLRGWNEKQAMSAWGRPIGCQAPSQRI